MDIIELHHVTKRFGDVKAIDDVSLVIPSGKITGLVGRNGSGKTVLMKIILGLTRPDSGETIVAGKRMGVDCDLAENTGAIIETPGFLPHESGLRNLKHLAGISGKASTDDIRKAMKLVGLDPDSRKHVGKYSLGMRQRLGLAQAIMEDPDILILDEPMNGLDKEGVLEMRRYLLQLKSQGKTILVASHSTEDIDALCDVVYEVDRGMRI